MGSLDIGLSTNEPKILDKVSGTGIGAGKLDLNDLKTLDVKFPSLSEQQKIASFFTLLNDRIQTQSKIIKEKKSLINVLRKKLYNNELIFFDRKTAGWENKIIKNVCQVVGGGTPDTSKNEYWNGNIQWFTPTEIKENFVSKSARTITEQGLKNSSAKLLPIGTILLTTRATIGEVAIAEEQCTTNQGFQSLIANENVNNIFLYHWLKNNKHELLKRANGSTFAEISKGEIENIPIKIPSKIEQKKVADILTLLEDKIEIEKKLFGRYAYQKKYLLQKMFI